MDFITWFLHIPILIFFAKKLKSYYRQSPIAGYFYPGLIVKFIVCIVIGAVYLYYYPYQTDTYWVYNGFLDLCEFVKYGETYKVFRFLFLCDIPATYNEQPLYEIALSSRTYYFFLIAFFFLLISFGNYWIACLYISLISFWAMFALADVLAKKYPYAKIAAVTSFLFWPTVLMWSSGLMKEVPLMIAVCVPVICVLQVEFKKRHFLYIVFSLALMYLIRPYYWVVYTPLLALVYLIRFWSLLGIKTIIIGVVVLAVSILFCAGRLDIYTVFSSGQLLQTIVDNNRLFFTIDNSGANYTGFSDLEPTYASMISHIPEALWVAFFEPNIVTFRSFRMLPSAICNTCILLFTLYAVLLFFKNGIKKVDKLALVTALYVFVLAVLLTLSSRILVHWKDTRSVFCLFTCSVFYTSFAGTIKSILININSRTICCFYNKKVLICVIE